MNTLRCPRYAPPSQAANVAFGFTVTLLAGLLTMGLLEACAVAKLPNDVQLVGCAVTAAAADEAKGLSPAQIIADVVFRCGPDAVAALSKAERAAKATKAAR